MKGLSPLALSSIQSLEASGKPDEEESLMDCNLPELLARDLELSNSLFMSKNMTAGAPAAVLSMKESAETTEQTVPYAASPSGHHRAHIRFRSLAAIEEKALSAADELSGLDGKEAEGLAYDSDSDSSSDFSSVLELPSIRLRDSSVVTAATSLTSTSFSVAGSVGKPQVVERRGTDASWIDGDSDSSDSNRRIRRIGSDTVVACAATKRRFPAQEHRPGPTLPSKEYHAKLGPFSDPFQRLTRGENEGVHAPSHLHSRSASRDSRKGTHSVDIPKRRSWQNLGVSATPDLACSPKCSTFPVFTTDESLLSPISGSGTTEKHKRPNAAISKEVGQVSERVQAPQPQTQTEKDDTVHDLCLPESEDETAATTGDIKDIVPRTQKPFLANVNVQKWLDSSIEPMAGSTGDEPSSPGVPLPPDVVESVRVSITWFPETMLLTSSLSIETIRAYSRKLKNPSVGIRRKLSLPNLPRKWHLTRVLPRRHNSVAAPTRKYSLSPSDDDGTSRPAAAPPPWIPLRNIFNCTSGNSDYLCDALYSHIVAYNYISTLIRTLPAQPRSPRLLTGQSSHRDSKEDPTEIPKKAAFLLGLDDAPTPEAVPRGRSRLVRKGSAAMAVFLLPRENAGCQAAPQAPAQERADIAMRDLHIGLAKCIARLVATMKKLSGAEVERGAISDGADIDPLFMRSLCEIVRCCEDAL